jgi:tetratricopeptide (TPR) repeat protein
MDVKLHVKNLFQEAELYRSQGLFDESKSKYREALALVEQNKNLPNRQNIIDGITKKLDGLIIDEGQQKRTSGSQPISQRDTDLIKRLFTTRDTTDQNSTAIEGAIALAKFGQHEKAIEEFYKLLHIEGLRLEAAQNILRCHIAILAQHNPYEQFNEWEMSSLFTNDQLENIRTYLNKLIDEKGFSQIFTTQSLPTDLENSNGDLNANDHISEPSGQTPNQKSDYLNTTDKSTTTVPSDVSDFDMDAEDDYIDLLGDMSSSTASDAASSETYESEKEDYYDVITTVEIATDSGPQKGKAVELAINMQNNDVLNFIISQRYQKLLGWLKPGLKVKKVLCKTLTSSFEVSGKVITKEQIKAGPKKGDFSVDLKIENTGVISA